MLYKTAFLYAVTGISLITSGHALPQFESPAVTKRGHSKLEARVNCDPVDGYTMQWFLSNSVCQYPPSGACLFYTRGLSMNAQNYARDNNMITIWNIWESWLYNASQDDSNRLRCIMDDYDQRTQYFSSMSAAFVSMCDGVAYVMDPNPATPRTDGIWGQVEFPTLQRTDNQGTVNTVIGIDGNGGTNVTIWTRGQNAKLAARATGILGENCGIGENGPEAYQFDDAGSYVVYW
ncbi:hypothetical protein F4677DRAFT_445190 [Hypoxylon crocopeplum]|nr:hypothetical protein F4677DRAFT_445190 [Hypoxylon crocopeplum]